MKLKKSLKTSKEIPVYMIEELKSYISTIVYHHGCFVVPEIKLGKNLLYYWEEPVTSSKLASGSQVISGLNFRNFPVKKHFNGEI